MKTLLPGLALLAVLRLGAGDWPQFRGPLANGVATDPDVPSRIEAGSVRWTADLPGRGLSSPIVVGDRIFVTSSSGPKQERLHVICFNARDGSKRWERQFWATGRTMCHEKTAVAAPSPASDGERVFALFSSNDLIALDLDGQLLWLRGLMRDYPNASNSLGMSSSLLMADGVLVAVIENDSESFTAGLDVRTGVNRWKIERPKMANWTSPALWSSPSGRQHVLLQSSEGLTAVEPATGKVLWDYAEGASTIPSSTVAGGVIYVPSKGLTALTPADADGQPPRQLWRSGQLRPATPSPLVVDHQVFTVNDAGVLTSGDVVAGGRRWQLRLKGPFSATPVAAGGLVYCVNEKGLLQVVDVGQPEGAVLSEFDLGQTILSTPAIAGGALYLRSDTRLWKLARP